MRLIAAFMFALAMFAAAPPAHAQDALGVLSAENGVNVSGTRWQGQANWSDERRDRTLYFRPDGVLDYAYAGMSYDNGRWLQNDSLIVIHTNHYFAVLVGTLNDGAIIGSMHNRTGNGGAFTFFPQGATTPPPARK